MLNFIDFEVFHSDWLCVIINPIEKTETVVVNDRNKLIDYYEIHKDEIFVGYNIRRYDQYVMKAILLDMNPKEVSDYIILRHMDGWQYSKAFNKVPLICFDVMLRTDTGLKTLEGMMGNSIRETSVPFDIQRKLTDVEVNEVIHYCRHDVEQTVEVFMERKSEFDAALGLVNIFKLPMSYMGKTGAQRVAAILDGLGKQFDDEFHFPFVTTMDLGKYDYIADWYRIPDNHDYKKHQDVVVAGVPHVVAWGGLHGARKKYHGKGIFLMADVDAYYPSLQLVYKFGYRNMGRPDNFELIYNENMRLKKLGDKKARLPYKIAANSISGQLKDKYSKLYDPMSNNSICVNGQLLLIDLIDKLEGVCTLIQSNTDGILLKVRREEDLETIDDIVYEWEQRTGMHMEFDVFHEVFQKDVNNYLLVGADGKTKTKGAYTKSLTRIDNDLPIINKAIIDYMVQGTPVENTIRMSDKLIDFQKVVKLSGKYWRVWHKGKLFTEKCYRVFASTRKEDGYIGKLKQEGATIEKFGNTPDRCFINNGDIKDLSVPDWLDKQYYIDLAKKRLEQYGVTV